MFTAKTRPAVILCVAGGDLPLYTRAPVQYEDTVYGLISKRYSAINPVADGLFALFGRTYFGFYNRSDKAYCLNLLSVQAQKRR